MKRFNKIMSGFTKTIADLEALSKKNDAKAKQKTETINVLKADIALLDDESQAADRVRYKLNELISG